MRGRQGAADPLTVTTSGSDLHSPVDTALDGSPAVFHFQDFLGIRYLRDAQFLGHLRAYLSRIPVDGLTAAYDQVEILDLADSGGQCVGGGQRIGTGKSAVGQQIPSVRTAEESFADDVGGTGRTHGQQGNRRSGVRVLDAERLFERIEVFGVENSRQGGTVDGAVGLHGILAHIPGIRDLLGQYYDFQTHCLFSKIGYYSFFPVCTPARQIY